MLRLPIEAALLGLGAVCLGGFVHNLNREPMGGSGLLGHWGNADRAPLPENSRLGASPQFLRQDSAESLANRPSGTKSSEMTIQPEEPSSLISRSQAPLSNNSSKSFAQAEEVAESPESFLRPIEPLSIEPAPRTYRTLGGNASVGSGSSGAQSGSSLSINRPLEMAQPIRRVQPISKIPEFGTAIAAGAGASLGSNTQVASQWPSDSIGNASVEEQLSPPTDSEDRSGVPPDIPNPFKIRPIPPIAPPIVVGGGAGILPTPVPIPVSVPNLIPGGSGDDSASSNSTPDKSSGTNSGPGSRSDSGETPPSGPPKGAPLTSPPGIAGGGAGTAVPILTPIPIPVPRIPTPSLLPVPRIPTGDAQDESDSSDSSLSGGSANGSSSLPPSGRSITPSRGEGDLIYEPEAGTPGSEIAGSYAAGLPLMISPESDSDAPNDDEKNGKYQHRRCVLWVVQKGQTASSLAESVGSTPTEIFEINGLTSLTPGQVIRLPVKVVTPCCD